MTSTTAPTPGSESLSEPSSPATVTQDDSQAEPQTTPGEKQPQRRKSRPDQVDPRPLPSMDEWREVRRAKGCMYYGFYANNEDLQKMLIYRAFPKQLGHRDPSGCTFLYPALIFLRKRFRRRDICPAVGYLPQRAIDLNPQIEDEVGEPVLILGLFPLEEEAYLNRMTQAEVDKLSALMGSKPTWWRIAQLMPSV